MTSFHLRLTWKSFSLVGETENKTQTNVYTKILPQNWKKKQQWNMKGRVIPLIIGALGTATKDLEQGLEDLEIRGRRHSNSSIIMIGQNKEKSQGDLKRLAVIHT